ncbi:unnamed protein product [Medioppia subpectinata]|uniref:Lipase domain-containing protein n=1 Tax=Medioppia subpectinata TaxID=1979941 RepID=A0A7R9LUH4_9ACAR|nr:unnamed protein product [Medioppia subpectinata]CAG2121837.1 unnamed protein product [Medioppia subpectinata]
MHEMKDKMLEESEQTIAIVGWGKGSELAAFKYPQAAVNVEPIGVWLAGYVLEIKKKIGMKIKIWGIGLGLGAHLMGIAGRNSAVKNCASFARITGLDPSGPGFDKINDKNMLRKTDSQFTDVIHTDSYHKFRSPDLLSLINHYGTLRPLGSLDIYVNYGYDQPNAGDFTCAGNHLRAVELFMWSIENEGELKTQWILDPPPDVDKPATKQKRVVIPAELGYYCDNRAIGNYFLETNDTIPWK